MKPPNREVDFGVLIRRSLFFLVLVSLALGNLFLLFRGLSSPHAMDQAQIAREMARGNGASTKFIRPADYHLAQQNKDGEAVPLTNFKDTYHAPLNLWINAVVFKMIGADDPDAYPMAEEEAIFPLDRVVATVSTIFFLLAIGMNYLLIARIFDAKIAGVCAIIMLFSSVLWEFSLSGLPQMLMLLLFSTAMYFVYRAIEAYNENRSAMMHALLAGLCFSLLALTHWVAIWIALGYILFAAITFRPRGVAGVAVLVLLLIAGSFVITRNIQITGEPFGSAFITRTNGLGMGSEIQDMRNFGPYSPDYNFKGLIQRVAGAILAQTSQIVPMLAGIVIAPLFFLSLLHPFKSRNISLLRWAVLSMWVFGALGLAFFGIGNKLLEPNQIHLLFAPLMTAYAVALISILWTRLEFVGYIPMLRNAHLIVICLFCAAPLILELPREIRLGMQFQKQGGIPNWPPYYAPRLQSSEDGLRGWVDENEVVVSDQPWAVAWYADRMSIWIPPTREEFLQLENIALDLETPITGILITPSSHGMQPVNETINIYDEFAALVLNGGVLKSTHPRSMSIHDKASKIKEVTSHYSHITPVLGFEMIYYSERPTNEPR